jgi:protein SCO1/2
VSRKTLITGISAIIILVGISAAVLFSSQSRLTFRGEAIAPPVPAADIRMPDQNGNDFALSAQRGKVVLLFFGFLNCPDECPLTMAKLSQAMNSLGDSARDVQVVLVSTDPVRDTPQGMKEYLANFNPTFLGITGSQDQLQQIWNEYGVEVLDGGETHSAYTYVIDQKGNLRLRFDTGMTPDEMASDLSALLARE